jgi:hypothetical protein
MCNKLFFHFILLSLFFLLTMGIDYRVCDKCHRAFCDAGEYSDCEKCERTYCFRCTQELRSRISAHKQKYYIDSASEDGKHEKVCQSRDNRKVSSVFFDPRVSEELERLHAETMKNHYLPACFGCSNVVEIREPVMDQQVLIGFLLECADLTREQAESQLSDKVNAQCHRRMEHCLASNGDDDKSTKRSHSSTANVNDDDDEDDEDVFKSYAKRARRKSDEFLLASALSDASYSSSEPSSSSSDDSSSSSSASEPSLTTTT